MGLKMKGRWERGGKGIKGAKEMGGENKRGVGRRWKGVNIRKN